MSVVLYKFLPLTKTSTPEVTPEVCLDLFLPFNISTNITKSTDQRKFGNLIPGNYDGQGYMDCAVFRPNGGVWHILGSNNGLPAPFADQELG